MRQGMLSYDHLPRFDSIDFNQIESALETCLDQNRSELQQRLKRNYAFTWKNLMEPLEEMEDRLHQLWAPINHLSSVKDSEELRQIHDRCVQKIVQFQTEYYQNVDLYQAIQSISKSTAWRSFNVAQQSTIKHFLKHFKLAGVTLSGPKKKEWMILTQHHEALSNQFAHHVLDATQAWRLLIKDPKKLQGVPAVILTSMKEAAQKAGLKGYLCTLDIPVFQAVMKFAENRELREKLYEAYVTRASDVGPHAGRFDNTLIMEEILLVRQKIAQLLKYPNYAQYVLATHMVKHPEEVQTFLQDLIEKVRPRALKEWQDLKRFAKKKDRVTSLQAWDVAYYSEKFRQELFNINQEELRPYFPVDRVLQGLFTLVNKIFGLKIKAKRTAAVWDPEVKFFEVFDHTGKLRGCFYTDLYVRSHKRAGAWMDECRGRWKRPNHHIQVPIAFLNCNFSAPTAEQPSLLTHEEVLTLFHEFGHCLHHLLTQIDYLHVSGLNGVEWDAIELPSQFLELFAWEESVIEMISCHVTTRQPFPHDLYEKLVRSRHFQMGLCLIRQLELSVFDFELHLMPEFPEHPSFVQQLLQQIRKKIAVIKVPAYSRSAHTFAHIFSGDYSAGYYSYLWAEVLSCDAFSKFREDGILNRSTGFSFLHHILAKGGSEEALQLFIRFRGRKPKMDAFLRELGLK